MLYGVQTTLPEAGGRVGEVPVAVSWEWLPGAPCSSLRADLHVNLWGRTASSDSVRSAGVRLLPASPHHKKEPSEKMEIICVFYGLVCKAFVKRPRLYNFTGVCKASVKRL